MTGDVVGVGWAASAAAVVLHRDQSGATQN
jgi:hypothetical protein